MFFYLVHNYNLRSHIACRKSVFDAVATGPMCYYSQVGNNLGGMYKILSIEREDSAELVSSKIPGPSSLFNVSTSIPSSQQVESDHLLKPSEKISLLALGRYVRMSI